MVSLSQYILHTMGLKPLPYWKSFWYQTPCRIFSISDVFSDSIHTIQNLKGEMHFHDSENIMVPDKWFDFLQKFWLEKEDAKNKTTFRLLLAGWSFIVLNWIQFWNWGGGGGGKSMKYIEIHHNGRKSLVDLIWSGWKKLSKKTFFMSFRCSWWPFTVLRTDFFTLNGGSVQTQVYPTDSRDRRSSVGLRMSFFFLRQSVPSTILQSCHHDR